MTVTHYVSAALGVIAALLAFIIAMGTQNPPTAEWDSDKGGDGNGHASGLEDRSQLDQWDNPHNHVPGRDK